MPKAGKFKSVLRYGCYWKREREWSDEDFELKVEFGMILRGGRFYEPSYDRECGEGLPYHIKKAMKLMWPDMYFHRWTNLVIDEFLKTPGRTACFGPSSSQKSLPFSRCGLVMFYANPDATTVLVSSTDLEALKRRIWDYVVSSDKKARERFDWLPGSLIESKLMLLADESDTEGRSYKNGIVGVACKKGGKWEGLESYVGLKNEVVILICDECFAGDTLVDTICGPVPIRDIRVGDSVVNASGIGRVIAKSERIAPRLVSVHTRNGKEIRCTPEHPFLTQKGWKKAFDLNQSHFIVNSYEAMRILRSGSVGSKCETFLRELLRSEMVAPTTGREAQIQEEETTREVRVVRKGERTGDEKVLQLELCGTPHARAAWIRGEANRQLHSKDESRSRTESSMGEEAIEAHDGKQSHAEFGDGREGQIVADRDGASTEVPGRERNRPDRCGANPDEPLSERDKQLSNQDWYGERQRIPDALQGGLGISGFETRGRGGRSISQQSNTESAGPEEGGVLVGDWVDSVEVFKQGDSGAHKLSGESNTVYNLQVDTHPSYSVMGLLVHNCHFMSVGFLDSLANLESNPRCYSALLGNLPDVDNPLGWAAEPKVGWDALPDTDKSRVYDTKWRNGRCIQFIGMDSPNLDYPEGQEPYIGLIGRDYIEKCAHNYGKESDKFNMFASGKIPRSSMHRTVFTKAQCYKFNATKDVNWGHNKFVRGYGLDAAYSGTGGDRTVGFPFIFGKDTSSMWRLWLGTMRVFPGSTTREISHSEAIAIECKHECEERGIEPEHVFFDGTGRSELTSAFGRLWSPKIVPIEFGGPATDRPSFTGEKHFEGEEAGNTKMCHDVFDRYVTELWFALRTCIMSDQMRGMNEEAILEGSQRKWEIVRGAKYCIETKEDMKERGLRSPDINDAIVCCIEGARRLGFPLGKTPVARAQTHGTPWLDHMRQTEWDTMKSEELV